MAKKINTGRDLKTVKNSVGTVVLSITEQNMVMIRTEAAGTVLTCVVISMDAAKELGIYLQEPVTTIGELESKGLI